MPVAELSAFQIHPAWCLHLGMIRSICLLSQVKIGVWGGVLNRFTSQGSSAMGTLHGTDRLRRRDIIIHSFIIGETSTVLSDDSSPRTLIWTRARALSIQP